jgi:tetratricopeptide (TPR) repeat protein
MKSYQPWDDSWQYDIVHVLLPYQSNTPVDMGWNFSYPVFIEAINSGLKGEPFWKSVAGAMIYVMGHQPDNPQVPSYVRWLKAYNPAIIHELIYDGVENALANRLEKAIWIFQAAVLLNPDLPECHYNLGLAYSQLGFSLLEKNKKQEGEDCLKEAVQYFKNTLELDPNVNFVCFNIEYIYDHMGMVDEGKKIMEKDLHLLMEKSDGAKPIHQEIFKDSYIKVPSI